MSTRIVSRSGKEKPCVSNELPQPIEKKCLTVLGHETEVWIFPTDDTDSSLSETEEEEDDESDDEFDGIPMKQLCGYNPHKPHVFSDCDRDQHIQNIKKNSVDSTNVKYLRRKSQILPQNCAFVSHSNSISIEKKFVTVLGHKTDVWIFPSDDSDSSLSEEDEDENEYLIERGCIQ